MRACHTLFSLLHCGLSPHAPSPSLCLPEVKPYLRSNPTFGISPLPYLGKHPLPPLLLTPPTESFSSILRSSVDYDYSPPPPLLSNWCGWVGGSSFISLTSLSHIVLQLCMCSVSPFPVWPISLASPPFTLWSFMDSPTPYPFPGSPYFTPARSASSRCCITRSWLTPINSGC